MVIVFFYPCTITARGGIQSAGDSCLRVVEGERWREWALVDCWTVNTCCLEKGHVKLGSLTKRIAERGHCVDSALKGRRQMQPQFIFCAHTTTHILYSLHINHLGAQTNT